MQGRIERALLDLQYIVGVALNNLCDRVAMRPARREGPQNQQI
jgi:hypothetical protein